LTYDRSGKTPLTVKEFEPGQYDEANQLMLQEERAHPGFEVVLLEAPDLDQVRLTHSRFFERFEDLLPAAG
jgi:hypothetical protein